MRVDREWRDPSGEQVFASSSSAAGSWYHNTVLVEDCEGETLAYIKFKLGAVEQIGVEKNNDPTYTVITVHDLVGNEVAVAYMPRGDPDAADWRHRRIVVHDRSSGMKMVEIDGLNDGEDWRISFKEGSEVLGGLGSDPRVMVMLVAWHGPPSLFLSQTHTHAHTHHTHSHTHTHTHTLFMCIMCVSRIGCAYI